MIKNAFILCGGFGKRLGEITKKTAKPLIKFNNVPFIEYLISQLANNDIKKIYLLTHYKFNDFKKKYHLKKIKRSQIHCIKEAKPLGTGGAILNAKKYLKNNTLLLNGDSYLKIPFKKILKFKLKKKIILMMLIKNDTYKSNKKLSKLEIKKSVVKFSKKNFMNAGVYLINKKIIKFIINKKSSLENEVIPKIINKNLVNGIYYKDEFIDIGLKKNFKVFQKISNKLNIF